MFFAPLCSNSGGYRRPQQYQCTNCTQYTQSRAGHCRAGQGRGSHRGPGSRQQPPNAVARRVKVWDADDADDDDSELSYLLWLSEWLSDCQIARRADWLTDKVCAEWSAVVDAVTYQLTICHGFGKYGEAQVHVQSTAYFSTRFPFCWNSNWHDRDRVTTVPWVEQVVATEYC